jgi:hypothetical protein
MGIPAITGVKATVSWRCPGVMTREIGRAPASAARGIVVLTPPRERPNASRSVLETQSWSFDPAPCVRLRAAGILRGKVRRRRVAGAGGVLMGTDHRGVHPHRPLHSMVGLGVLITTAAQLVQDPGPGALS